jgi:hypothetical protein
LRREGRPARFHNSPITKNAAVMTPHLTKTHGHNPEDAITARQAQVALPDGKVAHSDEQKDGERNHRDTDYQRTPEGHPDGGGCLFPRHQQGWDIP